MLLDLSTLLQSSGLRSAAENVPVAQLPNLMFSASVESLMTWADTEVALLMLAAHLRILISKLPQEEAIRVLKTAGIDTSTIEPLLPGLADIEKPSN